MKVDSKSIVELEKVSRGIFVASFATFIFTSLFAISLANSGALSQNATASVASANTYNSNKLALIAPDLDDDVVPGTSGGGRVPPTTGENTDPVKPTISTVTLSASQTKAISGGQVKLTWKSENVSTCVLKKGDAPLSTYTSSTAFPSGSLLKTTIFTLECVGDAGKISKSVTVTVPEPIITTAKISANPTSVAYRGEATLAWSSENARACKITKDGAPFSSKPSIVGASTGPLLKDTMFKINCTGIEGKDASAEVVISVAAPARPTATLSVETKETTAAKPISVKWSSTGASKCVLMRGSVPISRELNGTMPTVKITESTVLWLSCSSEVGTVVDASTVTVI